MQLTARVVTVVVLILLLCPAAARADAIDDYAAAQLAKHHVPGMAVAVVKDGKPVKVKGYGLADVEHNVPVTDDTVFQLASVTKQFTAAAVMQLVEDGRVSLDDAVSKHVDALPEAWQKVTIRQLLNHTSGIPNYTSSADYERLSFNDVKPGEVLKLAGEKPL